VHKYISVGQSCPKAVRIDSPEVMLPAVDEGNRHLIAVLSLELRITIDVALFVGVSGLSADSLDDLNHLFAQMATWPGQHHNPRLFVTRSSRHRSAPGHTFGIGIEQAVPQDSLLDLAGDASRQLGDQPDGARPFELG
jgi:hypothetical protein